MWEAWYVTSLLLHSLYYFSLTLTFIEPHIGPFPKHLLNSFWLLMFCEKYTSRVLTNFKFVFLFVDVNTVVSWYISGEISQL